MVIIAFHVLMFVNSSVSYATITDKASGQEQENEDNLENTESIDDATNVESIKEMEETELSNEAISSTQDLQTNTSESFSITRIADVSILNNSQLTAELKKSDDKNVLTLELTGESLLKISLGFDIYVTFILPEELDVNILNKENISAYYDTNPLSGRLRPLDSKRIEIGANNLNSIGFDIPWSLIGGIDIGGLLEQTYQLVIKFDQPITVSDNTLEFKAIGSENALIDIDIIKNTDYATTSIQLPKPPELLPTYSNTIVIKGALPEDFQSGSTVHVYLPDGTRHPAEVSDGEFKLTLDSPLSAGEKVKAVVTTETGLESSANTVTVLPMPSSLVIPENLNFGTVTIGSNVSYKFLEEPLEIKVQDTRGTNTQWELQASVSQPLTTKSGHILPNALGFYEGEEFKPFTTNELGTGDAITIKTGTTENDEPVTFDWDPKQREGPVIKIDHSAVYAEPYSTEVTWTLVDSVQ